MPHDIPTFHDGHLTGIALKEKGAVVSLRRSDSSQYALVLSGLEALQVTDFREGNIVAHVEVITGREPDASVRDEIMRRLFPAPHSSAAQVYQETYATFIEGRLAELSRGEAALLVIEASYGADLLAFCEAVECTAA